MKTSPPISRRIFGLSSTLLSMQWWSRLSGPMHFKLVTNLIRVLRPKLVSKFLLGYEDLELWFFGMKVGSFIICGGYDVREYATKCKFKYHKKKKKKKKGNYEVELKIWSSTVCCGTWRGEKKIENRMEKLETRKWSHPKDMDIYEWWWCEMWIQTPLHHKPIKEHIMMASPH